MLGRLKHAVTFVATVTVLVRFYTPTSDVPNKPTHKPRAHASDLAPLRPPLLKSDATYSSGPRSPHAHFAVLDTDSCAQRTRAARSLFYSQHFQLCKLPTSFSFIMVSYIDMAVEAVKALKERGGSSSQAIKKVGAAARPRAPHFGRADARPRRAATRKSQLI